MTKKRVRQFNRKQAGYLMVPMMIALFVIGALLTLYAERQAERVRLERGEQIGYALATLGAGFTAYLDENYTELIGDRPNVGGFPDPLRPTAKQLIDKLSIRGVAHIPPLITGASYKFQVSFAPGCSAQQKQSEVRCRPIGLAYIDRPLTRGTSGVDYVALARAARVMKGQGGYASPASPSQFTFPDTITSTAALPITNPTGAAGVLAYRADPLSGDEERLKTNGGNRMKNALRLDGNNEDHDLIGVKDITASGSLITGGRLQVKGGEPGRTWGMTIEKDAIVKGDFSVRGDARFGGAVKTDHVNFPQRYTVGQYCKAQYSIGMSTGGDMLYCGKAHRWDYFEPASSGEAVEISVRYDGPNAGQVYRLGKWAVCASSDGNEYGTASYNSLDGNWYVDSKQKYKGSYICYKRTTGPLRQIRLRDMPL